MFLSPAEYPAIRAAIDITLDASNLPDSVISMAIYQEEAERWVLTLNPEAAAYVPDTEPYRSMKAAAIYACAALIVPAVPNVTGETFGQSFRYTREKIDAAALANSLWDRARQAISAAKGEEPPETKKSSRFVFSRAPANRSRTW